MSLAHGPVRNSEANSDASHPRLIFAYHCRLRVDTPPSKLGLAPNWPLSESSKSRCDLFLCLHRGPEERGDVMSKLVSECGVVQDENTEEEGGRR